MKEIFEELINSITKLPEVQSIGKTGSKGMSFSQDNDVDVFIICENVPDLKIRQKLYNELNYNPKIKTNDFDSIYWGTMDYITFNKCKICLMYFQKVKVENEINDILKGNRIRKEDNYFYPIGKCSTYKNMNIFYDKNKFLENMKMKLQNYPKILHDKSMNLHLAELYDTEDLENAVHKRALLFYHFALDNTIDHYLQLLFTSNYCFFPSRKRSLLYLQEFEYKPKDCVERSMEIVKLGGEEGTLKESYEKWKRLLSETVEQIENNGQPAHNNR